MSRAPTVSTPAMKDLIDGKADYLIAGYYPGVAEAARGGQRQGRGAEPGADLPRDVRRLLQEIALPLCGQRIRARHPS